jgi:hypothetical protein
MPPIFITFKFQHPLLALVSAATQPNPTGDAAGVSRYGGGVRTIL